ncbi:MAG: competence/damage-inducible protein A, partial [Alphaproteobacteria bacterium]|nr:competence/damage-inducible protein A [Alphaproteobacteria bacterium]
MTEKIVTAAVLIVGNEILSGRTKDANLAWLAVRLNESGVQLREARVVPDLELEIVAAVNALRSRYDYVFTTGGIGPTHDDITSGCVAKAFGVKLIRHPEAVALLRS